MAGYPVHPSFSMSGVEVCLVDPLVGGEAGGGHPRLRRHGERRHCRRLSSGMQINLLNGLLIAIVGVYDIVLFIRIVV